MKYVKSKCSFLQRKCGQCVTSRGRYYVIDKLRHSSDRVDLSYSKNAIGVKKSFKKKKKKKKAILLIQAMKSKSVTKINAIITFPTSVKIHFVCLTVTGSFLITIDLFGQFVRFSQGNSNCRTNEW